MRLLICLLSVVLVSGCAGLSGLKGTGPESTRDDTASAPSGDKQATVEDEYAELTPDLMLALLVGELAGQRGDLNTAIAAYIDAAESSQDPAVATRAVQIATYARNVDAAKRGLKVLQSLQPDALTTHRLALSVYAKAGDVQSSIKHARRLLELSSAPSRDATISMGVFLAREATEETGLKVAQGLLSDAKDPAAAQYSLSRLALHHKQSELAEQAAIKARDLEPEWSAPYIQLARIFSLNKRPSEALKVLQPVANKAQDAELLMMYGQLLAGDGQTELAATQFEKILELDAEKHSARMALALVYIQKERLQDAKGQLTQLVELEAYRDRSAFYLGRIERWSKRPQQAMDWFSKVGQGSLFLDAQTSIAAIQADQGQIKEARQVVQRLRAQNPDRASDLYILEGELLHRSGEVQGFYALMNKAVHQFPKDLKLRYSRALAAVEAGHLEVLESDLRMILEKKPNDVDALNALGYSLASETERFEEASVFLMKAIELRPEDPAILDSVGWLYYRQGQYELALEHLQRAYKKFPDGEIAAHLGEVLWTLGRKQEARKLWRDAMKKDPNNRHLKEVLERFK